MAFDPSVLYTFGVVAHHTAGVLEKIVAGKSLTENELSYTSDNRFLNEGHNKLWSSIDGGFVPPKEHPEWDVLVSPEVSHYQLLALHVFGAERLTRPGLHEEMATYRDIIERLPNVTPQEAKMILPYLRDLSDYTEMIR